MELKRKWPTLCGCSTCMEPSARVQEAKVLSEVETPPEAVSEAGRVEMVALNGTGCAGEAAKWDWAMAWTVWNRKAGNPGERGTGKPEGGLLKVATLGIGARLAEDDLILTVEVGLVAAMDKGILNKAASWLVFVWREVMTPVEKHKGTQLLQTRQQNSEQKRGWKAIQGPCNNSHKCKPPCLATANRCWQHWLQFNFSLNYIQPHVNWSALWWFPPRRKNISPCMKNYHIFWDGQSAADTLCTLFSTTNQWQQVLFLKHK